MSARSVIGTALVFLVLWVQALAPAAALRAPALADPLAGAAICHAPDADAESGTPRQEAPPACGLCVLCQGGLAPILPPPPASVARRARPPGLVSWAIPPPAQILRPYAVAAQPRAPPALA